MKYNEARSQFKYALDNQQTISIPKLKKLMQAMNISLKPSEDVKVKYLKSEIKKMSRELRRGKDGEGENYKGTG